MTQGPPFSAKESRAFGAVRLFDFHPVTTGGQRL
jgi:hypothetical protein